MAAVPQSDLERSAVHGAALDGRERSHERLLWNSKGGGSPLSRPTWQRVLKLTLLALPSFALAHFVDPGGPFPQFSKARSLNSDGFKIALDLLLKSQIPTSGVAEIPFSFGVRSEGESKLSGKVMVKYLEQLAELYWWKFGPFLILLAVMLVMALVGIFLLVTGKEYGTWH